MNASYACHKNRFVRLHDIKVYLSQQRYYFTPDPDQSQHPKSSDPFPSLDDNTDGFSLS
jgi:hypothetical protein